MDKHYARKVIESWTCISHTIHSNDELFAWIKERNENIHVDIKQMKLSDSKDWYMDEKEHRIKNKNGGFFSIQGLNVVDNEELLHSQPVIIQDEIGYLGIITKEIDGILYFLMQAKIEPGNVNKIQISPTIQATRSNFMQLHKGRKPAYLDFFLNAKNEEIIVDQIQSEQSSRFYKKRNRNIIINVKEEIEPTINHKFMTLGQIKYLMHFDNLVNMDTRTVLSCLPLCECNFEKKELLQISKYFKDKEFFNSVFGEMEYEPIKNMYRRLNNMKMFQTQVSKLVGLDEVSHWTISDEGIRSQKKDNFEVIYCDIEIEGREVKHWNQPLFKAVGDAMFGVMVTKMDDRLKFLCKFKEEVGCFDVAELGPSVQLEYNEIEKGPANSIEKVFFDRLQSKTGILYDVMLSEEGGRFYHEQNRNIIMYVEAAEIDLTTEDNYIWLDFSQINHLIQFNNVVNIQLRNLLSLLELDIDL